MGFYDLNTTKPIIKSNGVTNLTQGGSPNLPRITLGGILEKLVLITQGTAVYTPGTGTIAQDINGPYNLYSNISVIPNQQVPIISVSGYGAWLYNLIKDGLENDTANPYATSLVSVPGSPDGSFVNGGSQIVAPSGSQSSLWTFPIKLPVVQRMFNGIVGYWELGNPLAQLTVSLTTAYTGSASPYGIGSTTVGNLPYLLTGNAVTTLATPTVDIVRYLYDTPVNPQDRPPVTFINTIIEDTWQNNVGSSNQLKYTFAPLSGYLARVIGYTVDSTTGKGVAPALMLNNNSFTFGVGDGTNLISENIYENLWRQRDLTSFDAPQGTVFMDFLGKDLTWQNIFSTYDNANINMAMNFSSNVGANSYGKVIRQVLKPLQYTSK